MSLRMLRYFAAALVFSSISISGKCFGLKGADRIACAPSRADTAAAITDDMVWITRDGGRSWVRKGRPVVFAAARSTASIEGDDADTGVNVETGDNSFGAASGFDGDDGEDEDVSYTKDDAARIEDLAVDDDGNAARLKNGKVSVLSSMRKSWKTVFTGDARAIVFDAQGRLFVLSKQSVLCFAPVSQGALFLGRLSIRAPVALVHGPEGSVRVFNKDGVFAIKSISGQFGLRQVLRISKGTSAASRPIKQASDRESRLIALDGKVVEMNSAGDVSVRFRVPEPVEALLVDARGEILFYCKKIGWRSFRGRGFSTLSVSVAAVDADGRYWQSGPDGLVSPSTRFVSDTALSFERIPFELFRSFFGEERREFSFPEPPRCKFLESGLLPRADLGFSFKRSSGSDAGESRARHFTYNFAFGALLTWQMGREDNSACLARHRRYQEAKLRLRRRASNLEGLKRRAVQRLSTARTISEAVAARVLLEKIDALLLFD
jgi:hypothetical protein